MTQTPEDRRAAYRKWYQLHATEKKLASCAWRKAHPEQRSATDSKRYKEHPETRSTWAKRHPEKKKAITRRWAKAHPEQSRDWHRAHPEMKSAANRKRRYGVTAEEYAQLLAAQGGVCQLCRKETPLCIDHEHTTGTVRGLLCKTCNAGLGMFHDDSALLHRAADYCAPTTTKE